MINDRITQNLTKEKAKYHSALQPFLKEELLGQLYSGYLAIQEVFKKIHSKNGFYGINKAANFMFMLGAHDMETNPLLIIEN